MDTSLSKALSPELSDMFPEIPQTIPNYLSSYTLSPVLREASVDFSLNCVLNDGVIQEVLNSEEGLLGSDGWPPVLPFFKDRETHSSPGHTL